jgi:hypothetical protein
MADLGRVQRGNYIALRLAATSQPDSLPTATIRDPGNSILDTVTMFIEGDDFLGWSAIVWLGGGLALGTYQATYLYSVDGSPFTTTDQFEVVAGGDSGGKVISLFSYTRPEGSYVLAQLESGRLVQGKNPHL